jgi:hypothetical protein
MGQIQRSLSIILYKCALSNYKINENQQIITKPQNCYASFFVPMK